MSSILIAEDEPRIASFVQKGLRANGFAAAVVDNGLLAREQALSGRHDLLVLDIGLPHMDGFTVLAELRASGSRLPVIVLTARDSVAGLEGGANDYMAKPFRFEELLARIRRRLADVGSGDATVLHRSSHLGTFSLNLHTRQATVDGQLVDLSAREYALAETFMRHPGHVLSREQLLSAVWGYQFDNGSNVVDVYVRYLRRKLGSERIVTVRGMGYRLQ
jgi:DNA-binding response OmpR family regulator